MCSAKVCKHCLEATSQILTVWSADPETKWLLSGEKATDNTQLVWPERVLISVPWLLENDH